LNIKENDKRIFHFVSSGYTDWFTVASIIFDEINKLDSDFLKSKLIPISYTDWESNANRPQDSRLNVDNIFMENSDILIQPWENSIRYVVRETFLDILEEVKNEH
jgi:dTDP-4-dehydrorhamnose reductase